MQTKPTHPQISLPYRALVEPLQMFDKNVNCENPGPLTRTSSKAGTKAAETAKEEGKTIPEIIKAAIEATKAIKTQKNSTFNICCEFRDMLIVSLWMLKRSVELFCYILNL